MMMKAQSARLARIALKSRIASSAPAAKRCCDTSSEQESLAGQLAPVRLDYRRGKRRSVRGRPSRRREGASAVLAGRPAGNLPPRMGAAQRRRYARFLLDTNPSPGDAGRTRTCRRSSLAEWVTSMHDDHINRQLGRRLKRRRRMLGLSQQALGEACGLSFQQIQRYEAAVNRITAAKLWELSHALEVEISYFFDGLSLPSRADQHRQSEKDAAAAI